MKYFIDTADLKEIKKWKNLLGNSFAGITTNSTMLKSIIDIKEFSKDIYKYKVPSMVQVKTLEEVEKVIKENNDIIVKVSMIEKNLNLINFIKSKKIKVAATTCYDIIQINQAIEMKMDYSMVYYHKNYYKYLMGDAVQLKRDTGSNIKLVAASIRNNDDVKEAILSGIEYATVKPKVLEEIFNNKQAITDLNKEENIIPFYREGTK